VKDPGGSHCCPIFGERTDSKAQIIVNCVLIHIITKMTQEFIIRRKFLPVKDSQLLYDIPLCPHFPTHRFTGSPADNFLETPRSCMGLVSMVAWYRFVVLFRDFTRLKSGNH